MSTSSPEPEIVEPEVLPPIDAEAPPGPAFLHRLGIAFGPIVGGLMLDTIDFMTFGQFGIMLGLLIGGTIAYAIASTYRLPVWQRLLWAIISGLYCTFPRTEFIPLATLIGACARFYQTGREAA